MRLKKSSNLRFWPEYLQVTLVFSVFLLLVLGPSQYRSSAYLPAQDFPVSDFFVALKSLLWPIKFQLSHLGLVLQEDFARGLFLLVSSLFVQGMVCLLVCSPYLLWKAGRRQTSIFLALFALSLLITGSLALTFD